MHPNTWDGRILLSFFVFTLLLLLQFRPIIINRWIQNRVMGTLAGLNTLPFNKYPFCSTWNTEPGSFPGIANSKVASWIFGSNFSPSGSTIVIPCKAKVPNNCDSTFWTSYSKSANGLYRSAFFLRSALIMESARARLSTDSRRSFANCWIAKDFAALSSRLVCSWRVAKSVNDFSYFS